GIGQAGGLVQVVVGDGGDVTEGVHDVGKVAPAVVGPRRDEAARVLAPDFVVVRVEGEVIGGDAGDGLHHFVPVVVVTGDVGVAVGVFEYGGIRVWEFLAGEVSVGVADAQQAPVVVIDHLQGIVAERVNDVGEVMGAGGGVEVMGDVGDLVREAAQVAL